jgi:hypothetical protein
MTDVLGSCMRNALSGMTGGPAELIGTLAFYAKRMNAGPVATEKKLIERLRQNANDPVRKSLNEKLGEWDWETNASWAAGTPPNSRNRRNRIYELLRVNGSLRKVLDEHVPPYEGPTAIIIDDPKAVQDWYTSEFRSEHNFYWKRLRTFLKDVRNLDPRAVNSIESSADKILERLADPGSNDIFAARGLVVGYVQSGKTTNFTAVIAKAIDAGYRLVVVLSGTTNLLRDQTQRRLDMELVGRENIQGATDGEADHDYIDDEDWPKKFISYGQRPGSLGSVDILRLTTQQDFSSKEGGFNPVEFRFEKIDKRRPLFARENLEHAGARIAVIKKQQDRLNALIKELKAVGKQGCSEIPTLIIDDESDQASVNTVNPRRIKKSKDEKERTRINSCIVQILELLPRAQYVGYTATPFANVFINPYDPEDLYPKHFIVSLERPLGYMGAREFVDFEAPRAGRLSNREAYIRDVPKPKQPKNDRLLEALDAFVLAGAIKKYREAKGAQPFKHHTMLYHRSVKTGDHKEAAKQLRKLWKQAGYDSPGSASERLRALFEKDFKKVWGDRGAPQKLPKSFAELRGPLGKALDEFRRNGDPVMMVNSAEGAGVPRFDGKVGEWKVIVGGAKLSRGYTIEGLTVSYFRRRTNMQDTLMQMGRWFGYRPGFSDLVRLYIGTQEKHGNVTLNLYEAFSTMCRDEEDFRRQLAQYAHKGGVTPMQVPSLVFNSYPSLRPTSRNKMFHAKLYSAPFDYREPTSQAVDTKGRASNERIFKDLLRRSQLRTEKVQFRDRDRAFDVKWATIPHPATMTVLEELKWGKTGRPIDAEIGYLKGENRPVDSWLFLAPQVDSSYAQADWEVGEVKFRCVARQHHETRFGGFSSPEHVDFAEWLLGDSTVQFKSNLRLPKRTGILLFYPTRAIKNDKVVPGIPVMGFALALPKRVAAGGLREVWVVRTPRDA